VKPKSEIKAAAKGAVSEDRALPNKTVTYFSWSMKLAPFPNIFTQPLTLDELCNNETELPIREHTTDTAGATEIIFALFDL